jgi:pimeloyl-ACP methyl ester carboxylesterase
MFGKPLRRRVLPFLAALALTLCASGAAALAQGAQLVSVPGGSGVWLSPAPRLLGGDPLSLAELPDTAVIVYNHGSLGEGQADPCEPAQEVGGTTPRIVRNLAGEVVQGYRLAIFAFCTATKTGRFRNDGSGGPPKVAGRRDDIKALVQALRAAGVPAERLFLMGHSAGGFASLLVERDAPDAQNAVIAFAPAFAGPRSDRSQAWWDLRARYVAHLQQGREIDALVFSFEDDPYNRPQDLTFLQGIPGITLDPLSSRTIEGVSCGIGEPHRTVFLNCFGDTQEDDIQAYLATRLPPAPGGQAAPAGTPQPPPQPAAQQPYQEGPAPVVQ